MNTHNKIKIRVTSGGNVDVHSLEQRASTSKCGWRGGMSMLNTFVCCVCKKKGNKKKKRMASIKKKKKKPNLNSKKKETKFALEKKKNENWHNKFGGESAAGVKKTIFVVFYCLHYYYVLSIFCYCCWGFNFVNDGPKMWFLPAFSLSLFGLIDALLLSPVAPRGPRVGGKNNCLWQHIIHTPRHQHTSAPPTHTQRHSQGATTNTRSDNERSTTSRHNPAPQPADTTQHRHFSPPHLQSPPIKTRRKWLCM